MTQPRDDVIAGKLALLHHAGDTRPTGHDALDRAIGFARRYPLVITAGAAACGVLVATSPAARAGLRRLAGTSLKGLLTGAVFRSLSN